MRQANRSTATALHGSDAVSRGRADVSRVREKTRRRRLVRLLLILALIDGYLWYRYLSHNPFQLPTLGPDAIIFAPVIILVFAIVLMMLMPLFSGRSPHVVVRPEEIEVGLDEVRGLDNQVDEVSRTLNVFLGYATFRDELGGNPRRGILFEGPPGTGKTYMAKAMAKQAGVPFLFARRRRSSRCTTGRRTRRSAPSSRRCASSRARRAARSGSSRRSTRSAANARSG